MPRVIENTTYYDANEVAQVINRHYEVALGRIREGRLKAEKFGGQYFVAHDDLVDYLEREEALPGSIIDYRLHGKPIGKVASGN